MIALLLSASLARAHGGEDHSAEAHAAPAALSENGAAARVTTGSDTFEAVVLVPRVPTGSTAEVALLLADYATSAPVAGATATLTLSGPGAVQAALGEAGRPGAYHGDLTVPAYGDYAGALVVTAPPGPDAAEPAAEAGGVAGGLGPPAPRSDVLAVTGLRLEAPASGAPPVGAGEAGWPPRAGRALLLGAVGLGGVLVGWLAGRRRGAAAAGVIVGMMGLFASRRVEAHGGEDHGETTNAPVAPAGATLSLPMDRQFLVGLRTAVLARAPFRERVPALGRFVARPGEAATLGAPVDGVLVAPPGGFPSPGRAVRAGDTLALLREVPNTADRAAIAQERAGAATRVAEARRALALAERDAAGIDALGDALSERERIERRGAVEVSRVALAEAEAGLAALAGGVTVPIRAPVDGRIGAVSVRPGDQVSAGQALFRVIDPAGLWMEARVPERLALGLMPGAAAEVIPAAAPERILSATVLDAGQEADPATGSVTVTLAVEAGALGLLPGMGGTAWIGRGAPRDALAAPVAAVVDSDGLALAFVKTGPETFEARALRLGARAGGAVEVLDGLAPGERVVTEGTYALRSLAGR